MVNESRWLESVLCVAFSVLTVHTIGWAAGRTSGL